ncbi:MAG: cyclase family protein [Ignavibacteria bacterium]|nr:cyclase family protein [Ignavibacteria bacterium]
MRVVDLTHPISDGLPVYFPWHPKTTLTQTANYKDNLCLVQCLSIGTHSGTHIDAPSHVLEGGTTLDHYDPGLWYREAMVLDFTPREPSQEITEDDLKARFSEQGMAVIIKTGWDKVFGREEYYKTYPALTNKAAEFLVEAQVPVVAADTPFKLDVHYTLLRQGIPLITNINNTDQLRAGKVKLIAAPLLIQGGDGAPARVLALVDY